MRLIDAESLYRHIDAHCDVACPYPDYRDNGAMCGCCGFGDVYDYIESEPTIEAIPLKFVREEIERLDKCKLTDTAEYLRNVLKYYDAVERGEETW